MADVLISAQHRKVIVPYRPDLAAIMPRAQRLVWDGMQRLVLDHDVDHTRALRNLGLPVPSPILSDYDWCGGTPWQAQKDTAAMLTVSPRAYVLSEMRTGKTRSVLYALDYLMRKRVIRKALIVAPLSTLNVVWGREVFYTFRDRKVAVLHSRAKAKRLKALEVDADFYVINHDGVEVIADELKARTDIDAVVFDELATYRESRTKRWKHAKDLVIGKRFCWGLTGKPTPNAPTDAYGQAKLLTPERIPKWFRQFQEKTMMKVSQFRWVPKKEAVSIVAEALKPSVRFTRNQIAESPPTMYLDRECALSPEALTAMKDLINHARTLHATGAITAHNAGVLINKLMQIATGWVYGDNGSVTDLSSPSRLQAVVDLLNETDRKALVFVPYVHAVEGVEAGLARAGFETCKVYGDTSAGERDKIFTAFQQTSKYDVMVAHPQCMAHGLLLTAADTVIWYGVPPSNEIYAQANDRVALPGLTYKTCVAHIIGHGVERRRYVGLRKQESAQEQLLDMLSGVQSEN